MSVPKTVPLFRNLFIPFRPLSREAQKETCNLAALIHYYNEFHCSFVGMPEIQFFIFNWIFQSHSNMFAKLLNVVSFEGRDKSSECSISTCIVKILRFIVWGSSYDNKMENSLSFIGRVFNIETRFPNDFLLGVANERAVKWHAESTKVSLRCFQIIGIPFVLFESVVNKYFVEHVVVCVYNISTDVISKITKYLYPKHRCPPRKINSD